MKKLFILIFLLVPITTFAASDDLLADAQTKLNLNFETASYYEFGFSTSPVNSGNNTPTPVNIGTPLLSTSEGGMDASHIKSDIKTVYAYWNIVSSTPVTLYLEMDGKLLPDNAPENYLHGIDWTVSKVEDKSSTVLLSSSNVDQMRVDNFITISPTLGSTTGSDASSRVGSIELQIQAEHKGTVAEMIAGTYTGTLTLGVVSNG